MNRRRGRPGNVLCLQLFILLRLVAVGAEGHCQTGADAGEPPGISNVLGCLQSRVTFDGSAVRMICLTPESVLEDMDAFWDRNDTFRLVRLWHRYREIPCSKEVWRTRVNKFTGIPPGERNQQPTIALCEKLLRRRDEFHRLAIPHICSFLPHGEVEFRTTVHFALGTDFSGFAADNFIVISISDPYWASNDSAILNAAVHEVFHIGYGLRSHLRTERPLKNRFLGDILQTLQNEGIATYVAYRARSMFPAPSEADFLKLENEADVLASLQRLGALFRRVERRQNAGGEHPPSRDGPAWMPEWLARFLGLEARMTPAESRRELWRIGVEQRAYYVGGAYMARTIDEKLGRDALVATIAEGPRSFVRVYNTLVDKGRRIYEFQSEEDRSVGQRLREAALTGETDHFRKLLSELQSDPPNDDRIQWHLWSAANVLHLQGRPDLAVETYRTLLQLNPESADALNGLGLIHLQRGERGLALTCFRASASLEPYRPLAFRMIRDLEHPRDD